MDQDEERTLRALRLSAEALCKKWKLPLLWCLSRGCRRFTELQRHLPEASPKVLTKALRELERDGLITRHVIVGGRKHVDYTLSPIGAALEPVLASLSRWEESLAEAKRQRQTREP